MGCTGSCSPPQEPREVPQYDPYFEGHSRGRSCTDIIWLILYTICLVAWGCVGYYGIHNGDIETLLAPVDSHGKRCGLDSGVEDKRFLMFFNIENCLAPTTPFIGCNTPQVCVKNCPTKTINFKDVTELNFIKFRSSMVCTDEVDMSVLALSDARNYIEADKCADTILQSQPAMGRCLVNITATEAAKYLRNITEKLGVDETKALEEFSERIQLNQVSGQIVHDLVESRWFLVVSLLAVIILCFIYILLLRWVVGPVVWVSLIGLLALLGFCIYLSSINYVYYKDHVTLDQSMSIKGYVHSTFHKSYFWLGLLVVLSIILVILLIIIFFLRSRINIAIELIREGSKAVTAIKSTILLPLLPWVIQCFVIAYGAVVLIHLMSIGESVFKIVVTNDTNCRCDFQPGSFCKPDEFLKELSQCKDVSGGMCQDVTCHFAGLENPNYIFWLQLANILTGVWTLGFINGLSDMILASTFSKWFWAKDKSNLPFFMLTGGTYRTLRYHTGTVSLGALIITIVWFIRVTLEFIDRKLKKFDNPVTKCIMCFCKCFCWCLENFLKFINKNAYIMCAMHGRNFCRSARDAFELIMRNIARTIVVDKVTDFIFFLSRLLLSIAVGFMVYYLLESNLIEDGTRMQKLYFNHVPAVVLSCATFIICTIIFNVYEMAINTLFLCFLEDCERNDGSPERPYAMSRELMRILGKKNKI